MPFFEPALIVASFGLASGLLWLATETAALAAGRPRSVAVALTSVAALLAACGLWWPGHLLPADPARGTATLLNALPALLLAVCAGVTGALASGRRKFLVIVGVVFMLMAAYGHAMLAAPGLFRLARTAGGLGAGAALVTLCVALVAAQLRYGNARSGPVLRVAAVLVAAAVTCLGAFVSAAPLSAATLVWTELLMLGGLIAVASVLRLVLGQGSATELETPARTARTATVDNLTGLPTRLYFESKLTDAARKCRDGGARLAVYFIDLDGFKPVNDTFGHSSGDRVLEQVGQRLKALARGAGVAARVGGDEFVLLAPAAGAQSAAAQLAGRVIEVLSKPYRVDEREVTISCSVGIALYPEGCSSNKLIARADAAMYAAKRAGGSRHCFYSREMDADVQQNFDMLRDLREALVRNELELFFQPKVDARSGKVTAAEALIRWNHPSRGMVMPGEFIPLAERSGLIGPLGDWVIEAACKQARAWRDKGLRMRVAINLSAYQMRQDDIVDRITDALARYRIHPSLLTCEITESAAMEDTLATQETFRRLGELGAHLSIDDFGTGYSSLSYLRRLPAQELKIDMSFVKDIESGADARAVVDAVVKLAHALGLKVVAEGVENTRQQQILVELGCDELQGYLFAKPMSARALLLWAIGDRSESVAFRDSLFGETRQTTREMSRETLRSAA
ncbi:MAG: bifunctional diguanylate cyclase/phosphodiesterase [Burkholderiales bacterium]|nr:bifunctional diguanylate cyclase/phosphodiesterase [Burkholderiales bacterium]